MASYCYSFMFHQTGIYVLLKEQGIQLLTKNVAQKAAQYITLYYDFEKVVGLELRTSRRKTKVLLWIRLTSSRLL